MAATIKTKMNFYFNHTTQKTNFAFYTIPKIFIDGPQFKHVSCEAKLLYMKMLDRLNLSIKNNWFDDSNRAYIYYTIHEIMETFCCATEKAVKLLAELEKIDFIEKKRQGLGKPAKIFVKIFVKDTESHQETQKAAEKKTNPKANIPSKSQMQKQKKTADIPVPTLNNLDIEDALVQTLEKQNIDLKNNNIGTILLNILQVGLSHITTNESKEHQTEQENSIFLNQELKIQTIPFPEKAPKTTNIDFASEPFDVFTADITEEFQEELSDIPSQTEAFENTKADFFIPTEEDYNNDTPTTYNQTIPNDSVFKNSYKYEAKTDDTFFIPKYIETIKENIEYDYFMQSTRSQEKELYKELFDIICDVVCVKRKTIKVGGELHPYEFVKSKFLKLTRSHLEYVINCLQKLTGKITNIKAYLITALYNATTTINHYQQMESWGNNSNKDTYNITQPKKASPYSKNLFNQFQQNKYDFDALEKQLLSN